MTTRIYLVATTIGDQPQAPRLIEAGTPAAARNHATRDMLRIKPATSKEVAQLMASGIEVEVAGQTSEDPS
jgi:hypothetical protein